MSDVSISSAHHGLGYSQLAQRWGRFVALGVALLLLGVLALVDVAAVTVISVVFIGAAFLVGGVIQVIHAFANKAWNTFLLSLLSGVIYIVGGFLIMQEPLQGSVVITLFLLIALMIGGFLRIFIALRHREMRGWWLLLISGVISAVLGILLFMSLPWSGLWVLGTLIAVELLIQGSTWLQFGLSLRRLSRGEAA
jgi:uncharacterized membrane protein HdeD (DUF308 family)